MKIKKNITILLFSILTYVFSVNISFAINPNDFTILPSSIKSNLTLTPDNNPYLVNKTTEITSNAVLTIEPGVEILVEKGLALLVYGIIKSNGTKDKHIIFKEAKTGNSWNGINFLNDKKPYVFNYTYFYNCAIYSENANIVFTNSSFLNSNHILKTPLVFLKSSAVKIDNCTINSNKSDDGIVIQNGKNISVTNSNFSGTGDAIEYSNVNKGIILSNVVYNSTDDCIDLNGSTNITISANILSNAVDKGISIGNNINVSSDNLNINKNIIYSCKQAIAIKGNSSAIIENNTFYNVETAINCYQKEEGAGGGNAEIVNTIFSNCKEDFFVDKYSTIKISYSLSTSRNLIGNNNIHSNPKFIDSSKFDFNIEYDSPCIDAGDPDSNLDPDSTRADIGALYHNQKLPLIVINEINYHSAPDFDTGDWVELYNADNYSIDISNWIFKDSDDNHKYSFPEGTILDTGKYIVLCKDLNQFKSLFSNVENAIGDMSFGMSDSGELIRLFDNNSRIIDSLTYSDKKPWASEADGKGSSLELINPYYDNSLPKNWKASTQHATPGIRNEFYNPTDISNKNDSLTYNNTIFPNPATDFIKLFIETDDISKYNFSICDYLGRKKYLRFYINDISDSKKELTFITNILSPGFYFLRIGNGNKINNYTFVILR